MPHNDPAKRSHSALHVYNKRIKGQLNEATPVHSPAGNAAVNGREMEEVKGLLGRRKSVLDGGEWTEGRSGI